MPHLTSDHIDYIRKDLSYRGIVVEGIQDELLDHMCDGVELEMEKGIRFIVADTGIGISKADQEKIFDKFFRSEDFRTRKTNGTGLGLYVTLKLARMIHADIDVQSELDKGSTFTIFIPHLGE